MVLTYIMWGYAHDEAIIRSFQRMGMEIAAVRIETREWQEKEIWQTRLKNAMGDIVFSVNFFAQVSDLCQELGMPYCTWVLQLPNYDLYTESVQNPCNYLGICDSYLVEKLWNIHVQKVFFLPDAVEEVYAEETTPIYRGVCFMDEQPREKLSVEGMSLYCRGYVEAFIHAQRVLYGEYILENRLIERVEREVLASNRVPKEILPGFRKLFLADYYLAPTCTTARQKIFLQNYDNVMSIYSDGSFSDCECEKHGMPAEEKVKKRIYLEKEFTLVLAPLSLHRGIPRQTLEVIAAGGFPLCSMQADYAHFFQNGENIACFHTTAEFNDLLVRFGNSFEERCRVREAAVNAVAKHHTYRSRMEFMLEMWDKLS